jgi:V8-like Glu-specific endopeptidase
MKKSIPVSKLNVADCPSGIEYTKADRTVAQIIENTFYLWDEYDIPTGDGSKSLCVVMKKPKPGPLSKKETQTLLAASKLWKESLPSPEDAKVLGASDPSLNARPIEERYPNLQRKMFIEPENLIGSDNRTRITDTTSYPWRNHCYLLFSFSDSNDLFRGTGCLVGPHMVLTCGHNVYDKGLSTYIDSVTITPGQRQDYEGGAVTRPYGDQEGVEFVTSTDYITSSESAQYQYDYGAIFYCIPFSGISTYIPLEFAASLPVNTTVHVAGYPGEVQGEINSYALWNGFGSVHSYTTSEELWYTVDTTGGQSGSPVLRDYTGGERIVAVHAFGSGSANGGPRLRAYNQSLILGWMQHEPTECPRPCEDCEPEDVDLGTITTTVWGGSVSGNCGNGGKWVGQFTGEAGAIYHFDLCPDSPGSGNSSGFDADIKITDSSCDILAGEDGDCSSPLWLPNNFQWTCMTSGTYYVIIAPYDSSDTHTCDGNAGDSFTLRYYKELQCSVDVTSPGSGWWQVGYSLPITWSSANASGGVRIELYKSDSLERVIEDSWLDSGSYNWSIPTDGSLIPGDDYQIRITDVLDQSCYDYSEYFGIAAPPVAQDNTVVTSVDTPLTIELTAVDEGRPDPPGALTYIISSLPAHGELSDPGAGPITVPGTGLVDNGNQVDYIPDTGYNGQDSFTFIADDGGTAPGGGSSNVATINIGVFDCFDVTIGADTYAWSVPMSTGYNDGRTQSIYLSDEIGGSGTIASLALHVDSIPGQTMNNWTIRMKHTTLSTYSTTLLESDGWTIVYQNDETVDSTGWKTFEFSSAFVYNDANNLMVDFSYNNSSFSSNGYCTGSDTAGTRTLYSYTNSDYGDPLDWSETLSPTVYDDISVPDIQLVVCVESNEPEPISADLALDQQWMYQNLPGQVGSNLAADVSITDDPMGNYSYTYDWDFILPADVNVPPTTVAGGDSNDTYWTFAAPGCDEPNGISDSGQPFTVKVTVTGDDYGNTGTAEAQFGIALLGDVNNDGSADVADRSIINAFWRTGAAGSFTYRDCNINCDGGIDVADRSIANAIWRGTLGQNSIGDSCPFR